MITSSYLTVLLLFFNARSIIMFWIILELNIITICLIFARKEKFLRRGETINQCLFYFIIQATGSILFLISIRIETRVIMIISIIIKLGIWPFHNWFIKLLNFTPLLSIIAIITIQKIPLTMLIIEIERKTLLLILYLNIIIGLKIINERKRNLANLLGGSSIYITLWIFIIFLSRTIIFLIMFLIYTIHVRVGCYLLKRRNFSNTSDKKALIIITITYFIGLPPFSIFFLKYFSLIFLSKIGLTIFLLIWILTYAARFIYFLNILKWQISPLEIYKKEKKRKIIKLEIILFTTARSFLIFFR